MALPVSGKNYRFKCVGASTRYLNLYSSGTASDGMNVVLWTSDSSNEQKWQYDGSKLRPLTNTTFALDKYTVAGNANNNNADIWTANDPINQNLTFVAVSGNTVKIKLASSPLYLTAYSNANGTGTGKTPTSAGNVYWASSSTSTLQQWTFEEVTGGGTSTLTLAKLKEKFPHGKFWNRSNQSTNNQDGYTSTACASHANTNTCNAFNPSGTNLSWQCMGFAEKCGYDTTGYNPREDKNGWSTSTTSTAVDSVKAGDIVRYVNGSYGNHSIFVTGVSGDTVTYGDCNGTSSRCEIRWGSTITKKTLKDNFVHLRKAPKTLT